MDLKDLGIEVHKVSEQTVDHGVFALPANFDRKRFAAKWEIYNADVGIQSGLSERLVGVPMSVPAWEPWIDPKSTLKKEPVIRTSGGKKFILLHRQSKVQKIVTLAYGNVSRKRMNNEVSGETVAGQGRQDPGILTAKELNILGAEDAPTYFPENDLAIEPDAELEETKTNKLRK
jgi:hypothetical protein